MINHNKKHFSLAIFDQLIVSLAGFLTGILIAKLLGVGAFGAYTLANGLFLILAGVQQSFLLAPLSVYGASDSEEVPEYLGACHRLQIGIALLITCLGLMAAFISRIISSDNNIHTAFLYAAILGFFILSYEFWRHILIAKQRLDLLLVVDIVAKSLLIILLITPLFADKETLQLSFVYGYLILCAAIGGILGWYSSQKYLKKPQTMKGTIKRNYSFGRWALINHFVLMGSSQIPIYIIAAALSITEVGIIGAAIQITGIYHVFLNGINNYYLPRSVRVYEMGGFDALMKSINKLMIWLTLAVLAVSCCAIVFADKIIMLVYTEEYLTDGNWSFRILLLVGISLGLVRPMDIVMRVTERMQIRTIISFIEFLFVTILSLPFVYWFGLPGIACVLVGGRFLTAALLAKHLGYLEK